MEDCSEPRGGPDAGWDMEEADRIPILRELLSWGGEKGQCAQDPVPREGASVLSTENKKREFHVEGSRGVFWMGP